MSRKNVTVRKPVELKLPPHVGAEAHERLMKRLAKMTHEEIFQTSVAAGIHNPDGSLTRHYAPSKKRK